MNPDELTETVRDLHERAFQIRRLRSHLEDTHTIPASTTKSMRTAAQALDDAAADLLNAFGSDMPKEVL